MLTSETDRNYLLISLCYKIDYNTQNGFPITWFSVDLEEIASCHGKMRNVVNVSIGLGQLRGIHVGERDWVDLVFVFPQIAELKRPWEKHLHIRFITSVYNNENRFHSIVWPSCQISIIYRNKTIDQPFLWIHVYSIGEPYNTNNVHVQACWNKPTRALM